MSVWLCRLSVCKKEQFDGGGPIYNFPIQPNVHAWRQNFLTQRLTHQIIVRHDCEFKVPITESTMELYVHLSWPKPPIGGNNVVIVNKRNCIKIFTFTSLVLFGVVCLTQAEKKLLLTWFHSTVFLILEDTTCRVFNTVIVWTCLQRHQLGKNPPDEWGNRILPAQ